MSRFYFHLRDGIDLILDEEGRECDGLPAIAAAALLDARSILADDAREGHIRLDQRIDVEDVGGVLIHRLQFTEAVAIVCPRGAD